jgi:hypothetical protein
MRTIDERQATDRLEQHVARAVSALPAAPRLELVSELRTECDDPTDFGPKGRIQVSRRYWLAGPPSWRTDEIFDVLREHWLSSGYRVLEDARNRAVEDMTTGEVRPAPLLWVQDDADGFRMTLVSSAGGDLSLVTTSPCIWPDGTPASGEGSR